MKLNASLTLVALTLMVPAQAGNKQDKEQLSQVSRIYVAGDGLAADKARVQLGRANACFVLADTKEASDAVLTVVPPQEQRGLVQRGDGLQGQLEKDGAKIWSLEVSVPTLHGREGAVGLAAASLVNMLEREAGCGKKKGALAQGSK